MGSTLTGIALSYVSIALLWGLLWTKSCRVVGWDEWLALAVISVLWPLVFPTACWYALTEEPTP